MYTAGIVRQGDLLYHGVCETATRIYLDRLGVAPTSFPHTFLALWQDGRILGSVGMWRGDEKEPFLTEHYCESIGVNPKLITGDIARIKLGEVCALNMEKSIRSECLLPFFILTYVLAAYQEIEYLFLTCGSHIKPVFERLGTNLEPLCIPNVEHCTVTHQERLKWQTIYFDQLAPVCCVFSVKQALGGVRMQPALIEAYTSKIRCIGELANAADLFFTKERGLAFS